MRPVDKIEAAIAGHADMLRTLRGLDSSALLAPSLLPEWSRARVVAHLAHKSRSHVGVFIGAQVGEVRRQYPTGQAAADAEFLEWSALPAGELCRRLVDGFVALEGAWADLSQDGWMRLGISSAGERSMFEFIDRHLRDLFVHYVDLDVGYGPEDWPATFVGTEVMKRLCDLPNRADPAALLAWLLGRAPSPELGPW